MNTLTITRQENKTIETQVNYELPAFFRKDKNEVLAVYSQDKVVNIHYYGIINVANFSINNVANFKKDLAECTEITESEFLDMYEKAINIMELTTDLVYRRSLANEIQDQESEMAELQNEENN